VLREQLDLHERRRRDGVPTVSLLAGPVPDAVRGVIAWAAGVGRQALRVARPSEVETALLGAVGEHLLQHALAWLAAATAEPAESLRAALARHRGVELELYLDARRAPWHSRAGVVARCALCGGSPDLDLEAVTALVPTAARPVLLLVVGTDGKALEQAAGACARAVERAPDLTIVVVCDLLAVEDAVVRLSDSRGKALFREGIVNVSRASIVDAAIERLVADSTSAEVIELLRDAAASIDSDRARSAAERFLHARLQTLPWAAGLFELNGGAGIDFGPREAEVDLLCRTCRIAVEIDGHHHFADLDAYRRDRRKDAVLQLAGYLVLRFLAIDIVARLEDVLGLVRRAIDARTPRIP
jgi:hypothetical protein